MNKSASRICFCHYQKNPYTKRVLGMNLKANGGSLLQVYAPRRDNGLSSLYVLDDWAVLIDCSVYSFTVFNDDGRMAVNWQAEQAIPPHTDPLPNIKAALNEVLSVALFFA